MQLTNLTWKTTEATNAVRVVSDGDNNGLSLVIQAKRTDGKPSARTYIWRGRINGQIRKITIGRAEAMKVTDARRIASEITNQVLGGGDPWQDRQGAKEAAEAAKRPQRVTLTVNSAFALYMRRKEEEGTRTVDQMWRQYRKDVEPIIGDRAVADVSSDDLADIVNAVGQRAKTAGDRLQALLSPFFKWCASSKGRGDTGLKANPMIGVEKPHGKTTKRNRRFSEREMRWFLTSLRELRAEASVNPIRTAGRYSKGPRSVVQRWSVGLEVLLRTGQRKMDVLGLTDAEVDYETHLITIAAERYKTGVEQVVWMVPQVEALLRSVDRPDAHSRRSNSARLFQRLGADEANLAKVRERMAALAAKEGHVVKHWTIHDLRRTMASTLADMVDQDERAVASTDEIKKVIGHTLQGAVAHYLHGDAIPLKRRVMRVWNAYLDGLIGEETVRLAA